MELTINQVFKNRVAKYGDRLAVEKKWKGVWQQASWNQYYERARAAGLGLVSLGVNRQDRVCLISENRLEWLYADMGTLGIGAVLVPIYPTLTDEEVEYIAENSDTKIIIVENREQFEKALFAKKTCSALKKIVVIDTDKCDMTPDYVMSFNDLLNLGRKKHDDDKELFAKLAGGVTPDDLATFVYTSGTTGVPKGAMITHKNIMAVVNALNQIKPPYGFDTDQTVPFLPLSHVFERIAGHFYGMYVGLTASYAESIDTLLQDLKEKRPTEVLAVPRVCEKVYQKITMQVKEQPLWKQKVFSWGQKVGQNISERREAKKSIPFFLKLKYTIAYAMIFKKLAMALGGRVRWMTASGAPTAKEIVQFFNAAGIMVVEGYGMTECTAPATMSNLADYKIGTAGRPLPGVEIKIADDGEILIKGDNVCKGYWKMEQETKEAFTPDGYLMSGDIGIIDENGFLMITDRKKDLIITSGGKNVAPQKIENLFKSDPLFGQCIVIGEKRKYLTALLNVSIDVAKQIADEKNIPYQKPPDLLESGDFLAVIDEHVAERNTHLAKYETIKKYRIVKNEFTKETGELTATLKVKRKVVQQMYKDLIDSMYDDEVVAKIE